MGKIVVAGEPMVEIAAHHTVSGALQRRFGGDTFNTAVYLSRLVTPPWAVSYLTRLGDDELSDAIIEAARSEGIATDAIARVPGKRPGLYLIETDTGGERRFAYWRSDAPARALFSESGDLAPLADADVIYCTGITLAIIGPDARKRLIDAMAAGREQGKLVAFDTNHRPALWCDLATARRSTEAALQAASLVLPSLDDLNGLGFGADPEIAIRELSAVTTADAVVKTGSGRILHLSDRGVSEYAPPRADSVVDTTGAGDAFNAGYIASALAGNSAASAIENAHRLALAVIARRGAIIDQAHMP